MEQIVFFDGECNLCNSTVDFFIRLDGGRRLHFASLQGETARKILPERVRSGLDTVVLWREGNLYKKSGAVLRALVACGGIWIFAGIFLLVPWFVRDFFYDVIAKNRFKWFGRRESCRLPTPEERHVLLP
jgi:predicted DCC family thiol-disulfide oxidoreductase YuxK